MKEKVNKEVAEKEIQRWIEEKRVKQSKVDSLKDAVATLVEGVSYGEVVVEDNGYIVQKLTFPIKDTDGKVQMTELKFRPRLAYGEIERSLNGVKSDNPFSMITAYAAAITTEAKGMIKKIDSEDMKITQAIVSFFL